jgi:tRNA threonylcarbamoyladenosine biosynthesis protein TsaB
MEKVPVILCLETSSEVCSVSLSLGKDLLSVNEVEKKNSHAEVIVGLIDQCLIDADRDKGSIDAVAVGSGPGSYTGLRIATSVAKGICYAYDIPLLAISSLDNLIVGGISENPDFDQYIAAIDARRMEVYTKTLDSKLAEMQQARAVIIDENPDEFLGLSRAIAVGSGAEKMREVYKELITYNPGVKHSAKNMIELAYSEYLNQNFQNVVYFEPNYLKEVYTTVSKKKLL